eukprot:14108294-Ditylum_brightwellii.AAC.1
MTLNILQPCEQNLKLSAYMALEGPRDYNAHPIAPLGAEMTVLEIVDQCTIWGLNETKGWYLGPSREHYRCYKAYIPSTKGECVALTIGFHTATTKLPHISPTEATTQAMCKLIVALQNLSTNAPFAAIGNKQLAAINKFAVT